MASIFKGVAVAASTGSYAAIATETNRRDVEINCTVAAYVVTDVTTSGEAVTAASAGNYYQVPANVIVRLDNIIPANTFIRAQSTGAGVASTKWYIPS